MGLPIDPNMFSLVIKSIQSSAKSSNNQHPKSRAVPLDGDARNVMPDWSILEESKSFNQLRNQINFSNNEPDRNDSGGYGSAQDDNTS